jgi:BirA family biotin operon repressor/biotin-[acetyl-CoA-carboxylase] ligase
MLKYVHLEQIDSTNAYLQRQQSEADIRNWVVSADEQTAGKGMGSNGWESEVGKNLTFSLALDMGFLPAERQFLLSEAVALGLIHALDDVLVEGMSYRGFPSIDTLPPNIGRYDMEGKPSVSMPSKLHIKWPNDIYYDNHKLAGILINSTIKANMMDVSIIGIGLNVNQMQFQNWPTHPVSLRQITEKEYDLQPLLKQVAESIYNKVETLKTNPTAIEQDYLKRLFRYRAWAEYEVDGKVLRLFMTGIDTFGRLMLINEANKMYCFDIKEIKFLV